MFVRPSVGGRTVLIAGLLVAAAGCGDAAIRSSTGPSPSTVSSPSAGETTPTGASVPDPTRPAAPPAGSSPKPPTVLIPPAVLPSDRLRVPILMYHRIDTITRAMPAIEQSLTVTPTRFAQQMQWLVSHHFHTLTQRQLYDALERHGSLPTRPVVITFDDGYADVYTNALPVLRRLHLHAIAYVITNRISSRLHAFLTWHELAALEAGGVEIGSHTVDHRELVGLPDHTLRYQLDWSRTTLERHLHHPVQWFSYPAGRHDARAARYVLAAGYVLAVTTDPGVIQDGRQPLLLTRLRILATTSVAALISRFMSVPLGT